MGDDPPSLWMAAVVVTPIFVVLLVLSGWMCAFVLDQTPPDDSDCSIESPVDERGQGCREICTTGPQWFVWGERQNCYWDDAPAEAGK